MLNRVFGKDVIDPDTGEIFVEQGQVFTEEHYELFKKFKNLEFDLIAIIWVCFPAYHCNDLNARSLHVMKKML